MGSARILLRIIAFCLHFFIAFILLVKIADLDIAGSWIRLLFFVSGGMLLAYSVLWHGIRFYRFIKTVIQ
ncbi:MAG: hypothetical protein QM664_12825 [Flavihumibacter sp.]